MAGTTTTTTPGNAAPTYTQQNPFPSLDTSQANVPQPIGVPAGYRPGLQETGTTDIDAAMLAGQAQALVTPLYYDGAQWGLGVADFPKDQASIIALQQQLIQAGYLSPRAVIFGQWEATSAAAFSQLLGGANQAGVDWHTALARALSPDAQAALLANAAVAKAAARLPNVTALANPDDLKALAQNVAQNLYGGNLPDADLNQFVDAFHELQTQQSQANYNLATVGGSYTQAPSPTTEITNEIKAAHPEQVAATQFGAAMDNIISTFTGSPGARSG